MIICEYLRLFAINYLWLFELIDYLWLFVCLIICNYLKSQVFEVIVVICMVNYLWLFERAVIWIIFIIWCLVFWGYLKCWLSICYLNYLWLFDEMANYLVAWHGVKINFLLQIRVTKTPPSVIRDRTRNCSVSNSLRNHYATLMFWRYLFQYGI